MDRAGTFSPLLSSWKSRQILLAPTLALTLQGPGCASQLDVFLQHRTRTNPSPLALRRPTKTPLPPPPPPTPRIRRREVEEAANKVHLVERRLGPVVFARQVLQRLAFRLGDQERGEDATEHEESEYLHDVIEPGGFGAAGGVGMGTAGDQGREDDLGDDGADFAGCGGEPVAGGSEAGGKTLSRYDEGCCVGTWSVLDSKYA